MTNFEEIITDLYGNGRFNIILLIFCSTACFLQALELQACLFTLNKTNFSCLTDHGLKSVQWLKYSEYLHYKDNITSFNGTVSTYTDEQCYGIGQSTHNSSYDVFKCNSYSFDTSIMDSNYVSQFELVCDRRSYVPLLYSTFLIFLSIGFACSTTIDRFGRKKVYLLLCTWQILAQIANAFAWNLPSLFVLRALRGFPNAINYLGLNINLELLPIKKRSLYASFYWTTWSIGYMVCPMLAYYIRDAYYLRLVLIVPTIMYIPLFFILMESPRWLLLNGKTSEAVDLLKRLAKYNNAKIDDGYFDNMANRLEQNYLKGPNVTRHKENLKSIFSSKVLITNVIIFTCTLTSVAFAYMGLTLSAKFVSNNIYLNIALQGFVEMPAILIGWLSTEYFGRRYATFTIIVGSSACVILTPFLSEGALRIIVAAVGKFAITTAYCIIDFYILELVPTSIRNGCFFLTVTVSGMITAFSPLFNAYSSGFLNYVLYGCLTLGTGLMMFLFVPETRGRILPETVADLEFMYAKKNMRSRNTEAELKANEIEITL